MVLETKKLGDIAKINTGLVVKRKQAALRENVFKDYKMLTLKSFEQDGWLNINELDCFESNEELDEKYLTQQGDVIVRLSYPNTSIAINENNEGLLIPSLFAIIRLSDVILLPDYLSIYLNSDLMKEFFGRSVIGSAIQIINNSLLKEIVVKFPKIEKQKKIIEFNKFMLREKELMTSLIDEKTKYNKAIIGKLITGGSNDGN
uniref:restriction endonuclease subunit S n=1 Tax=Acetivibrio cellulolyticus TaxID=35830 RepID=UPI00058B1B23|nr:restriction endonuclease subunit S [Acetivibrio cellulolyticus]